jgi:Zn-dependent protease
VTDRGPAYRPRKPSTTPSEGSLAERDAFAALARQSLPEVRASTEAWRNGLTAFLTLVTTGVIIKGRDTTTGVPTAWRVAITVLIGGVWQVLAAQAGTRYRLSTRQDIRRTYGAVEAYEVAVADEAADKLGAGRRLVVAALISLLAGVGVSWWAPAAPTEPRPYLRIADNNAIVCGVLRSADSSSGS